MEGGSANPGANVVRNSGVNLTLTKASVRYESQDDNVHRVHFSDLINEEGQVAEKKDNPHVKAEAAFFIVSLIIGLLIVSQSDVGPLS